MITEEYPMKKLEIPALTELLSASDTPLYPYNAVYEEVKNDPIFILHTSGSTGRCKGAPPKVRSNIPQVSLSP